MWLLSFTLSENEKEYDLFYLSSSGIDTSTCGKTMDTSCNTLEHVLSLHYNITGQSQKGLEIIMSKSFVIDRQIMVGIK